MCYIYIDFSLTIYSSKWLFLREQNIYIKTRRKKTIILQIIPILKLYIYKKIYIRKFYFYLICMHFILVSNRDRMWIKFIPAESSDFNLFTFVILSCTKVSFFWDTSQDMSSSGVLPKKNRPLIGRLDRSANQRPVFLFWRETI